MFRANRVALALLLVCLGGVAASAEDDPLDIAHDRAERLLLHARTAYVETERLNVGAAFPFLEDEDWLLRHYALVRLRAAGLSDELFQAYVSYTFPWGPDRDEESAEILGRIDAWCREAEPASLDDVEIDRLELAMGFFGMIREFLARRLGNEEARRCLDLELAMALGSEHAGARTLTWFFLLGVAPEIREELGLDKKKRLSPKDIDRVRAWYVMNRSYLYHHRAARLMRVDTGAQAEKVPTDQYRLQVPWPEGEGPDAPSDSKR